MIPLRILLARNLGCSRKKADELLAEVANPDLPKALLSTDLPWTLHFGEQSIELHDEYHLLLNKPVGCVTALTDARHPTVMPYVEQAPLMGELRPVGRLDLDTSGLLLFTTSGIFLHRLTHPRTGMVRTYHAALSRPFQPIKPKMALRDGQVPHITQLSILAEDEVHPSLVRPAGHSIYATISITGGAYHEVRRIFAALSSHVLALCRVGFGNFSLPNDLKPGQWQMVPREAMLQTLTSTRGDS
jgi:16S rRNA pseudouridine516 synthase